MYRPDERPDWEPPASVGLSNERALKAGLKVGDVEGENYLRILVDGTHRS
jgi:hypothetical protein